jgi:hypothetical protein
LLRPIPGCGDGTDGHQELPTDFGLTLKRHIRIHLKLDTTSLVVRHHGTILQFFDEFIDEYYFWQMQTALKAMHA